MYGESGMSMARTPEHYRQEAVGCRKMAQDIADADAQTNLFDVARQYDKLAEEAPRSFSTSGTAALSYFPATHVRRAGSRSPKVRTAWQAIILRYR